MTLRTAPLPGRVVEREELTEHLVRLQVDVPGWTTSGVPDEWVALTVPGQFQTRYYTVRAVEGSQIVLDVVIHAEGLVTGWAVGDCIGDEVRVSLPQGSYAEPDDARWLVLTADLTGLPAVARILETTGLPATTYVEAPAGTETAYDATGVQWLPAGEESELAALVRSVTWPDCHFSS